MIKLTLLDCLLYGIFEIHHLIVLDFISKVVVDDALHKFRFFGLVEVDFTFFFGFSDIIGEDW